MLVIRFSPMPDNDTMPGCRVILDSPVIGNHHGAFIPPYDALTWQVIWQILAPDFVLDQAEATTLSVVERLGGLSKLLQTVGEALSQALMADENIKMGFERALGLAESQRQFLPVELRFGQGCDAVAALPWELLRHQGRFLVADSSIALSRYPEGPFPPTPAQTALPLRVLLVLSEPLDAGPLLPQQARHALFHGLRRLDETGAVIVDVLRPPTFQTLTEALTTGEYHLLVFYGPGTINAGQGHLLFEDEFGGQSPVSAGQLGALVRNSSIRLVLLGACESGAVGEHSAPIQTIPDIWSGIAPALVRAGVPLAVGMQVTMQVDAALVFLRQFALSIADGESVITAVSNARKPLLEARYNHAWFIPALYGRPTEDYRLFNPAQPLPIATADIRHQMQAERLTIEQMEEVVSRLGTLDSPDEIAALRAAKRRFAQTHAELARRTPGGYAPITSPLYGVPSNRVFVGRHQSLIRAGQGLKREYPVVIWGAGGIGKSAMAIELAHRQSWRFGGGVLWLDCRNAPAFDTLLNRLAAFCGIEAPEKIPSGMKTTAVRTALAGLYEQVLLIWDNAEDVWGNREVREFLHQRPANVQVLLTTRENPEEVAWTVVELLPLEEPAMTMLFKLLAEPAGVKAPSQAEVAFIPQIVAWLEGHPLALTLVVPLAAKRGLQRVWEALQRQPLKGIEAAFAVSFDRLTADQQHLFMRLGVFSIPFLWEAAEAILPDGEDIDELLDVLVQRALIHFNGARYSFHALLRQFAYTRLQATEAVQAVHQLAATYLHDKLTTKAGTPEEVLEEVDQWEKAQVWKTFARRADDLVGSLERLGYWEAIETRLVRAQAAVETNLDEPALLAQLVNNRAWIVSKCAQWDEAITLWKQAQQMFERLGDIQGLASTYNGLGSAYREQGHFELAQDLYAQALTMSCQSQNRWEEARALNNLGSVAYQQRQFDKAVIYHQESLSLRRAINDRVGEGVSLGDLAVDYQEIGEYGQALATLSSAQAILQNTGDRWEQVNIYNALGIIYHELGQLEQAQRSLEKGIQIAQEIGDEEGRAYLLSNLGLVLYEQEDLVAAEAQLTEGKAYMQRVNNQHQIAFFLSYLALVSLKAGEFDQAKERATQALTVRTELGLRVRAADDAATLAAVHLATGDLTQAMQYAEQVLAILDECDGEGPEFTPRDYFICYQVLKAAGQATRARTVLRNAYAWVSSRADKFKDPNLRQSYLTQVAVNREIVAVTQYELTEGCA